MFGGFVPGRREQILKDAIAYFWALGNRVQDLGFKSFPTVYDMLILSNIRVPYTVGKLLTSTFQPKHGNLRTSSVHSPACLLYLMLIPNRLSQ